jgi:hypothetical protein
MFSFLERNWGYDGVFPFAAAYVLRYSKRPQSVVNECTPTWGCFIVDLVYNLLGLKATA